VIVVAIALLVVAGVSLLIGILSSSVPPLVCSVLATLAAGGVLWASFVHYRKEAVAGGASVSGLGGNQRLDPGYPQAYVPSSNGTSSTARRVLPDGWDHMAADDAVALVSAYNLDELHGLRRHEVEGLRRQPVVDAIDERIDAIVELRRRVTAER
jgi:hypothetical protein